MHKSGIIKITKPTRDNDKKYRYFKRKFKALMAWQGKEKNKQNKKKQQQQQKKKKMGLIC